MGPNNLAPTVRRSCSRHSRGFTLVELMVVGTIIGILTSIATPRLLSYLLEGRVSEAKPLLLDIAAKQRAYRLSRGKYCCSNDTYDERVLNSELGVRLEDTGNFCFVVVCRDPALCAGPKTTAFITPKEIIDPQPEFEVWAILRAGASNSIAGPNNITCQTATEKLPSTGWVRDAASGEAGREGRAVVLRYPAPVNGVDAVTGADGVLFQWIEGMSVTHALLP